MPGSKKFYRTAIKEKRLNGAKAFVVASDICFLTHHGGCYDTEGFASLHPRLRATRFARAFDLAGRAVVLFYTNFYGIRQGFFGVVVMLVIISPSEAVFWVGRGHHTGRFAPFVWC